MKPAHTLARLLRDLKHHVKSVNPGSEPFQSGLKSIEKTAWECLLLRNIEWTAIGGRTAYTFRAHTYVATEHGPQANYVTSLPKPKPVVLNAHQREVLRVAEKSILQYRRTAQWIADRYDDALEATDLNGRTRLRCLTGRATFETLVKARSAEIDAMKAGAAAPTGELANFVARHGQVHVYRDTLYATQREAQIAMREDSLTVSVDHDLIVDFYERAFTQAGGFEEGHFDELVKYLRSKDHRDALAESVGIGADKAELNRHDKTVLLVANAERKLAPLSDPLPPMLHNVLGVSKEFLRVLMAGKERTKESVRLALRERMYELCPSKRPKPRKGEAVIEKAPATLPPSMADNHPANCMCVRHGGSA
ncbi:MAG: hypothetical protein WA485_09010 [Candidatus Sulfotelmatobacter sp.]